MKNLKKITFIVSAVLLLLLVGFAIVKNSQKKPAEKILPVTKKTLVKSISASGKIVAKNQVDLKFQTSGQLVWVGVKEGDKVNAWQAIARLDRKELEKKLLKALRDYSKERWDFEEDRTVTYKDKLITDTARRILEKNQFDLDKAVADVEIADIALKFATLITPISGIVTHIDTPLAGINITPATAVFTIIDPKSLVFKADIDEIDIGQIKNNQEAAIVLDAYPEEEFKGKVATIGFVSVSTSGGGTAFPLEINLPKNKGLKFKIGMNGDTNIVLKERKNVLVIPLSAVFAEKGKKFVYLKNKNLKIKRQVITGLETEEEVEIKAGLERNDKIIIEK